MNKIEIAINKIREIYHPNYKGIRHNHWDDSPAEQRDEKVRRIIETLESDLKNDLNADKKGI